MPCLTYESPADIDRSEAAQIKSIKRPLEKQIENLKKEKANLEAALCAVMTSAERQGCALYIDEKEAGVTGQQIASWFDEHKKKDALRKQAEKEKKRRSRKH